MIKVLHVINTLEIGGAQRLLSDMLPVMKTQGIEVCALVNHRANNFLEEKLEAAGVQIFSLDIKNNYHPVILIHLGRFLKMFDIVHVHLFPCLYFVAFIRLFMKCKLVYTEHNTTNRRRKYHIIRLLERMFYSQYDNIVSINDRVQDNLIQWLGIGVNDKRFIVIKNGVNLLNFKISEKINKYPVTLIMISRFSAAKDQATVIRAVSLLDSYVHAIFVGDGPTRLTCEKLSESLKVSERCHFVGEQSDISSWIAKADIGIQSSVWDGFGLSAVEMMAGGLPVIATDVDGLRQVVEGAGIIVAQGNAQRLAEEIKHLICDKEFYQEVTERCECRAQDYNIEKTANAYIDVYKTLENE